ncbi:DUF3825 domain-containing protein [Ideonella sp. 4Y11]|uniref:DUF3825 domain-containing protein n=1 Tax=Ideonella aquatica TaxID=2824119 RepID=A0A940YN00_9BURK|nr:DUF3825 domain-containing protein [Ideonella aquatica]MBQ0960874.1 DUF3825 domain-containing protein [Ideonella aquatica]
MFTQEELLTALGDPYTKEVVPRFHRFAYVSDALIDRLAEQALAEVWGRQRYVLEKYIAVHVPWSIEQGRFTCSDRQFYVTAGHLQTRYGTPIYLVFERNRVPGTSPYALVRVGADIAAPALPTPPDIPSAPVIPRGAEIVMLHDHILGDNAERVPYLADTPRVAQMCAVAGSIQWSLNRGLELPYWYYGKMSVLVPLYLQTRENITEAPDLVAPLQVNADSLLVRTVLLPSMPYANARVAVTRHDRLPPWMLAGWHAHAASATSQQIEDPEAPQAASAPASAEADPGGL